MRSSAAMVLLLVAVPALASAEPIDDAPPGPRRMAVVAAVAQNQNLGPDRSDPTSYQGEFWIRHARRDRNVIFAGSAILGRGEEPAEWYAELRTAVGVGQVNRRGLIDLMIGASWTDVSHGRDGDIFIQADLELYGHGGRSFARLSGAAAKGFSVLDHRRVELVVGVPAGCRSAVFVVRLLDFQRPEEDVGPALRTVVLGVGLGGHFW